MTELELNIKLKSELIELQKMLIAANEIIIVLLKEKIKILESERV